MKITIHLSLFVCVQCMQMGASMIKSMTGFGRYEEVCGDKKVTVEMKSVNHRYLDMTVKLPRKFSLYESEIRSLVKEYVERGKVDLYIFYEDLSNHDVQVRYNKELAREYYQNLKQMEKDFSLENDVRVGMLSRYPEVLTMEEVPLDEEEVWELFDQAVSKACVRFNETRDVEGSNLQKDLIQKLDTILEHIEFIEVKSPKIMEEYRNNLRQKVEELLGTTNIDESRILTEVTIFADKVCLDEELVRLKSHAKTTRQILANQEGSVGRKLDFIAQEMNREANTILSKTNDIEVSEHAIELKTEIEKVREQIQNIE